MRIQTEMTKYVHANAVFSKHEETCIIRNYRGTDVITELLELKRWADTGDSYSMVQWPRK